MYVITATDGMYVGLKGDLPFLVDFDEAKIFHNFEDAKKSAFNYQDMFTVDKPTDSVKVHNLSICLSLEYIPKIDPIDKKPSW